MSRVREAFHAFLQGAGYRTKTIQEYLRTLRYFEEYCAAQHIVDIREVTQVHITGFIASLAERPKRITNFHTKHYSIRSIENMQGVLALYFRFLLRRGYILVNPCEGVERRKRAPKHRRHAVSEETVCHLLESIPQDSPLALRDKAICETLYGTGLRAAEVRSLTLSDVALSSCVLQVRCGKGGHERLVPFGEHLASVLTHYLSHGRVHLATPAQQTFFVSYRGTPLTKDGLLDLFRKRVVLAGLASENITPHVLRHSYATHMLERGASIRHIQELLGHTSLESTVIYTHFTVASIKKVLKQYHPRENELYRELTREEEERFRKALKGG